MEQLKERFVFITTKDVKNALNGKTYKEIREILEVNPGEHELLPNGERISDDVVCTVNNVEEFRDDAHVEIYFIVNGKKYGQMLVAPLRGAICRNSRLSLEG